MIAITTSNCCSETTMLQVYQRAIAKFNNIDYVKAGIQFTLQEPDYDDETDEDMITYTHWVFKSYKALYWFIQHVCISGLHLEIADLTGDDTFFDYNPTLFDEIRGFLKTLTETLEDKLQDPFTPEYPYTEEKVLRALIMALINWNAINEANKVSPDTLDEGVFFSSWDYEPLPMPKIQNRMNPLLSFYK